MRVLIAGASGFLGSHLVTELRGDGHDVVRLVRHEPSAADERPWEPAAGQVDQADVDAADLVVNLAGSPTVGNPHSSSWKRNLRESRVRTTSTLARAIAASPARPAFFAGNAVGIYGDHGDQTVTEDADVRADTLLGSVCRDWQEAADPAVDAGARVCFLRTAPVMDSSAAPLKQLRHLFRFGLGGRLGSGRQYFPMISLRDWLGAVSFLVEHDSVSGPVNLSCPETPTNAEFTAALADELGRKAFVAVPSPILKVGAGDLSPELLGSVRVEPRVLLDAGFRFEDPDVRSVLVTALS